METFTSNGFTIEFNTNPESRDEVLHALQNAVNRGLKAIGEQAVGYAQELCPVDTGNLRGSITYAVEGDDCYIGTNVEYAPYIEFGTGVYAETGGRQTPWVYQKGDNYYMTNGIKPHPFLRPSASNHADEYRNILKDSLENA